MSEDYFKNKNGGLFCSNVPISQPLANNTKIVVSGIQIPEKCRNWDMLKIIQSSTPNFNNMDCDQQITYLQQASQEISRLRNEKEVDDFIDYHWNSANGTMTKDEFSTAIKKSMKLETTHRQANKPNAGHCMEGAVKIALDAHHICWEDHIITNSKKEKKRGVDILIKGENYLSNVAAIGVKRTPAERWSEDLKYKYAFDKRGENIQWLLTYQFNPTENVIDEILELDFHLFLRDDSFPNIIRPNLHRRSTMPAFLRSLGAATTR